MNSLDFGRNAQIALAVAFGPDHTHRRLMDKSRIGTNFAGKTDSLGGTAWMAVD